MVSAIITLHMGRGPRRDKQRGGTLTRSEKAARTKAAKKDLQAPIAEHNAPPVRLPETDVELVELKKETLKSFGEAYSNLSRVASPKENTANV